MKPRKEPQWARPVVAKKKKTGSKKESEVIEAKDKARREREGSEMCKRRNAMRKPGSPDQSLTQTDLAELMCVQRNTITRWEVGRLEIKPRTWKLFESIEKDLREKVKSLSEE